MGNGGRGFGDVNQELKVLLKENKVLYNINNNKKTSSPKGNDRSPESQQVIKIF